MKDSVVSALQGLHRHGIVGPAAGAFLLRVFGAALQFLFTVLLARFYGAAGVGVFVISLSLLVVTSTIARWGLDQTGLKLVAANLASKHFGAIRGILVYASSFILLTGTIGTLLLLLLADWLAVVFFKGGEASGVITVMAAALLPFSLMMLFAEVLRGLRRILAYSLLHGALIPLFSILFLLLFQGLLDGVIAGAAAYLSASVLTAAIAIFLGTRAIFRLPQDDTDTAVNRRKLLNTSNSLAWVAIISVLMSFTETFILGLFHDEASVGRYAAALRLALLINFIIIAFNSILAPNFASLYRQEKMPDIQALARHSIIVMFVLTLPLVAIFCLLPAQVLSIFGDEFGKATIALILLSIGQLINVLSGPVGILLQMTGQERTFRNNVIVTALTTLISALVLVPPYAEIGASLSAVVGILLLNVLSLISVRNRLGINPLPLKPSNLFSRTGS